MRISSVDELQDSINQELTLRKKELINLRNLIHATKDPILCRAGIAFLCAHFEGFIKQAATKYVHFVCSQHIRLSEVCTSLVALQSKSIFAACKNSEKISVYSRAIDSFLSDFDTKKFYIKAPNISTESNPSSKIFKEIVSSIGLDFSAYETKAKYIDSDLLDNRHKVVHGERIYITVKDFDETFKQITEIMETFSQQIVDAAMDKKYLKRS